MKYLFTIVLILAGLHSNSFEKRGSIIIKVDGLKKAEGSIAALLFNTEVGFPDNPKSAFASAEVRVIDSNPTLIFSNLPPGKYAVSLIHDVNDNKDLDKNFVGIPIEPFGFSGNKSLFTGLPKFDDAAIVINKDQVESTIRLIEIF